MDIRPVRTDEDHKAAMAEIDRLWGSPPGTPEGDELDIWLALVEAYEKRHYHFSPPDPIEAIEFDMDRLGLTRKDLEQYIGTRARVWEVLNRKRPLSLRMIRSLEKGLGIPAAILVQEYELASKAVPIQEPVFSVEDLVRAAQLVFESTEGVLATLSPLRANIVEVAEMVYETFDVCWRLLFAWDTAEPTEYRATQDEPERIPREDWRSRQEAKQMTVVSYAGESGYD